MNALSGIGRRLAALGAALAALGRLAGVGISALFGHGGTLKERVTAAATQPDCQRLIFTVLRSFQPNLLLRRQLITSYPNGGTALVTRFPDVLEVLSRDDDFAVVYAPRMIEITGVKTSSSACRTAPNTRAMSRICAWRFVAMMSRLWCNRLQSGKPPSWSTPLRVGSMCRRS